MPPPPQPGDPAASTPADDGLVAFLRMKLAGEALPAAAGTHFHDCDIYAADPATLTAGYRPAPVRKGEGGSWFFFTHVRPKSSSDSRKKRVVGGGAGTWHSERAPRAVLDGEGNCVGHSQYFSYKRKNGKNSSERTDWYMVEFTEGQEGDHERIHGGEPVLVLCKIYRAHSGSRSSSSSSRSARKRKATEEHADASSAPVKAKRRLFNSSAPTLLPASQEQVSSRVTMVTSRLESQGEAAMFEQEDCHGELGDALDQLIFWASQSNASDYLKLSPNPEASQEQVSSRVTMASNTLDGLIFWASQSKMDSTSDYLKFSPNPDVSASQSKTSTTRPSLFMSETEMSQGNIGGTLDDIIFRPEPEPLQGMIGSPADYLKLPPEPGAAQNMVSTKSPSLFMSESETTFQGKISSSSDYLRFWSEPEASQGTIDSPSDHLKFNPEPEAAHNMGKISSSSDYLRFWSEPEASQGTIDSPSDHLKFNPEPEAAQNNTNTTPPSLSISEPETTQGKIGSTSDFLRFWPEPEATQKIGGTSDYLKFLPGTEALQKASTTPSQLMFEPEVQVPQGESETATFNWGQMTGSCAAPAPSHCYGMTDLDDSYWRGNNNNTVSCCHGVGCFVGAPPTLCSTARIPINPSVCGGPALWSC
ncbi:hypothetical protein SETIT_3G182600v2 [Setaria italica]|uniref:NAC domain-containing protein n=1 Tax=Setaria italica TaxID=4555 RepID=A0A368QG75_SETIT|nr:hypothetical protein SETIT_3G182600v2 [Setaria italica]